MLTHHYTTWSHWQKIQKEGLKPYPVDKPELLAIGITRGVYLWPIALTPEEHVGSILFQALSKSEFHVVKLGVNVSEDILYGHSGSITNFWHNGKFRVGGNCWVYHDNLRICIAKEPVATSQIMLVDSYDLFKLLKTKSFKGTRFNPLAAALAVFAK